jgi:hypothetical protein
MNQSKPRKVPREGCGGGSIGACGAGGISGGGS